MEETAAREFLLKSLERTFGFVIQNAPIILFAVDHRGTFTVSEGKGLESLGLKPGEVVGMSVYDIYKDDPEIISYISRAIAGEEIGTILRVKGGPGKGRVFSVRYIPVKNSDGSFAEVNGIAFDITNMIKAEEALRETDERLRLVLTNAPVFMFALDKKGKFTFAAGRGLRSLGLNQHEVVGKSIEDIFGRDPGISDFVKRALGGEEFNSIIKVKSGRGRGVVFDVRYVPFRDAAGSMSGVVGVAVDVTTMKRTEEALRESEERFRQLAEASFEAIAIHDGGRIVEVNESFAKMFSIEKAEATGSSIYEFASPQSIALLRKNIQTDYERPFEAIAMRKDGSTFFVEILSKSIPYRGKTMRVLAMRDISERKEAEEVIRGLNIRYDALIKAIGGIVYECDANTFQFHFVSRQAENIMGYPVESWVTDPEFFYRILHPDDRQWVSEFCRTELRNKRTHEMEYRLVSADGRTVWVRDIVTVVIENDRPTLLRGVMIDVTKAKRAEATAREREILIRTIFENSPECIVILDENGTILEINKSGFHTLGAEYADQLVGKSLPEAVLKDYVHGFRKLLADAFAGKSGEMVIEAMSLKNCKQKCELHIAPFKDSKGNIIAALGIARHL